LTNKFGGNLQTTVMQTFRAYTHRPICCIKNAG